MYIINIKIGESKTLSISDEIIVSKKGVVDITDQKDSYLITGLKEGVVMITEASAPSQKYFISVIKDSSDLKLRTKSDSNINSDKIGSSYKSQWIYIDKDMLVIFCF